jgi:hypothetical protein
MHSPPVCTRLTQKLFSNATPDFSTTMTSINTELVVSESQSLPLSNKDKSTSQLYRTPLARRAKGEIRPRCPLNLVAFSEYSAFFASSLKSFPNPTPL